MSIACDYPDCDAKTRQPLPHGWTPVYGSEGWSHLCPQHAGFAGQSEAPGGGNQATTKRRNKR